MGEYLAYVLFFLLFILVIVLYKKGLKKIDKDSYKNRTLTEIDKMTGEDFEKYLKANFENMGYKASLTPKTNDYGADILLRRKKEKIVVQAKRYKNKVGNGAVQEIVAAMSYYKATKAMVVTNSSFTKNAVKLAKANHVVLWDREKIRKNFQIK